MKRELIPATEYPVQFLNRHLHPALSAGALLELRHYVETQHELECFIEYKFWQILEPNVTFAVFVAQQSFERVELPLVTTAAQPCVAFITRGKYGDATLRLDGDRLTFKRLGDGKVYAPPTTDQLEVLLSAATRHTVKESGLKTENTRLKAELEGIKAFIAKIIP